MNTVFADYNAATESGDLRLNFRASQKDIATAHLRPGDWAWLSDGEVIVGAQLAVDDHYGVVGVPDWETLVHLDDDDSRDFETVRVELQGLSRTPGRFLGKAKRVFELVTIADFIAPPGLRTTLTPEYFSSLRAKMLFLLGKPALALLEIEDARRRDPDDPTIDHQFLEIVRYVDLPRARHEAEALALKADVPANVLAACINVLATCADDMADDEFGQVAERILEWVDRFDRAPGREQVLAFTLAMLHFNRAMILLRLRRGDAAREALALARAVDPILSEIDEAIRLTVYDQHARDLAARVRGRRNAA
jgi:hypothetical protein